MNEKDDDAIHKVQSKLYSRKQAIEPRERRVLAPDTHQVSEEWGSDEVVADTSYTTMLISKMRARASDAKRKEQMLPSVKILLIASVVFFVFSSIVSLILFFGGSNVVSARNIDIEIVGPVAIEGGQELVLQIEIINRNSIPLELADLIVEYPDGTRMSGNLNAELPRTRESIGTIKPGEKVKKTARAILFGPENSSQQILVTLEYRIQDSNAIFVKEASHDLVLSAAPIAVRVGALEEVVSGQDVEFTVELISNSTQTIEDVLLVAEYPQGFELTESNPKASFDSHIWALGSLEPKTKKVVTLRGVVIGQNLESRIIRFNVGVQSKSNERELAATFGTNESSFVIKKPFIGLAVGINGATTQGDAVVKGGEAVRVDIVWENNLPTKILDGEIIVSLSGDGYDRKSVAASSGFYDSNTNTIRWTSETIPELKEIAPGERGSVSYSIKTLAIADIRTNNQTLSLDTRIRGRRINEVNVPEEIESLVSKRALIATDLIFTSRSLYSTGVFSNSGPVPPKAETQTTYTVVWSLGNSVNDLENVKVVANIPSYVKWLGAINPIGEDVVYNPVGGRVTWNVGTLRAGVGTNTKSREVSFQIAITPSLSQVDESPLLVGQQSVSGLDSFTKTQIQSTYAPVTTELLLDPAHGRGSGKVTP